MKRSTHKVWDIQKIVFELLDSYSTSPWSSWEVILGWPSADRFDEFLKPYIYVLAPSLIGSRYQQGGREINDWQMIIGAWAGRENGGIEEVNIIMSYLIDLFTDPQTVHLKTFNVTLGATTYSGTTLKAQGLRIQSVTGPRDVSVSDTNDFKGELQISILA